MFLNATPRLVLFIAVPTLEKLWIVLNSIMLEKACFWHKYFGACIACINNVIVIETDMLCLSWSDNFKDIPQELPRRWPDRSCDWKQSRTWLYCTWIHDCILHLVNLTTSLRRTLSPVCQQHVKRCTKCRKHSWIVRPQRANFVVLGSNSKLLKKMNNMNTISRINGLVSAKRYFLSLTSEPSGVKCTSSRPPSKWAWQLFSVRQKTCQVEHLVYALFDTYKIT